MNDIRNVVENEFYVQIIQLYELTFMFFAWDKIEKITKVKIENHLDINDLKSHIF